MLENNFVENPKMPKNLSLGINNFTIDLFNFKKACKAFFLIDSKIILKTMSL
jgi:hypothetical protein